MGSSIRTRTMVRRTWILKISITIQKVCFELPRDGRATGLDEISHIHINILYEIIKVWCVASGLVESGGKNAALAGFQEVIEMEDERGEW